MPLLVKMKRSTVRTVTKYVGRVALLLALVCMSLEMIRLRGWGIAQVEYLASTLGVSVPQLWSRVASGSVAAAFALLIIGLAASALSRSRYLEQSEANDEIDVAAVSQRIRSFEQFEVNRAGRGTSV